MSRAIPEQSVPPPWPYEVHAGTVERIRGWLAAGAKPKRAPVDWRVVLETDDGSIWASVLRPDYDAAVALVGGTAA